MAPLARQQPSGLVIKNLRPVLKSEVSGAVLAALAAAELAVLAVRLLF
jgi:hypothetical protein